MAFKKFQSRRCPVCVAKPQKVKEVNLALEDILTEVKETGDLPKARDPRMQSIAHLTEVAPHSLLFHLKVCLVGFEIQDQRLQELRDLTDMLDTAKQEYNSFPNVNNATAVNQLLTQWRGLAEEIEGQTDPSLTIEFLIEAVLGPLNRKVISTSAEELKDLRDSVLKVVEKNQHPFLTAQFNAFLSRISSALRESTDESLRAICNYYHVELEAQSRKRAMDTSNQLTQEEVDELKEEAH